MFMMPGRSYKGALPPFTACESELAGRLAEHVEMLAGTIGERNIVHYSALPPLGLFYPPAGNFIAFVSNLASRLLLHRCIGTFRKTAHFPSEGLVAPAIIPGVSWSDHWSFWREGYPAIMLTDTALYRYPHYHQQSDLPDRLDYNGMARVVAGMRQVVEGLVK